MSSNQAPTPPPRHGLLTRLGAYGFGDQEPLILAALVTHDPLLLIGNSGTGKTSTNAVCRASRSRTCATAGRR